MIPANVKKYCVVCTLTVSVLVNGEGIYFCEKCKHEIHDDEPIRSQQIYPNLGVDSPYIYGSAASATGPYTVSPSPSAPPDGTS